MDWDLISQIATSAGALLAAGSLVGGFYLYRLNQRDEQAAQFRLMLAGTQSRLAHLKDQVSYELARELASTVVNSPDLELPLRDLYAFSHPDSGAAPDEEEIVKHMKENFPLVTVPINTPLVRDYQAETTTVKADIAPYQKDFPGLFRVLASNAQIISNVLRNEKEIARDDELWRGVLPKIIEDGDRARSFEHMRGLLGDLLTQAVMQHMQNSQRQIELLNQMLDLVMDVYFDQSPKDLKHMSRRERSEKVVPVTRTERITEDLAEARKCLRHVFTTTAQVESYDQLLVDFIATTQPSEKKSDEPDGADRGQGGDEGDDAQPALSIQA